MEREFIEIFYNVPKKNKWFEFHSNRERTASETGRVSTGGEDLGRRFTADLQLSDNV